jgi:hypothetical protein
MCSLFPLGAAPVKVEMPALSPTMEEGNIVKWLKKEGKRAVPPFANVHNILSFSVACRLQCYII